jgi:hypothetical protein
MLRLRGQNDGSMDDANTADAAFLPKRNPQQQLSPIRSLASLCKHYAANTHPSQ